MREGAFILRTLVSLLILVPALALAQHKLIVTAYHMSKPPVIDGTIDEGAEWKDVPSFGGLVDSITGQPVGEGGTFWLGYDEKFIYFAARLEDSQPKNVQATEYRTNVSLDGNDTVALQIDPFGHQTDINTFTMNPAGGTTVDIAGGRAAKREWLGAFLAKGRVTETGWQVECRIPWRIMRLPHAGTHQVLINVLRNHRRLQRKEMWQYTNSGHIENYGRWESPEIPKGVEKTIKLLPYGYGGYDHDNGVIANGGLDVRTPVSDTVDFVGSLNPDFRNVENGILNLDPSHFARQVAESRPFFLEGKQYFSTSMDAPLFTSQNISRFDLGFKTVGKLDRVTDLGLLDALSYTSENDVAAKVRRQVSAKSWIEAAGTSLQKAGYENTGSFLQFHQDFGPYSFFAQHEATRDSALGYGHRYNTGFTSFKDGLSTDLEYVEITSEFNPALGFAPEHDFHGFNGNGERDWTFKGGRFLDQVIGGLFHQYTTMEGQPYRRGGEVYAGATLRKDSTILVFDQSYDRFAGNDDIVTSLQMARPRNNPYRSIQLAYNFGKFGGQRLREPALQVAYRPINKLQLGLNASRIELGDLTQNQLIGTASWDLGNDRSINGRVVRQGRDTNAYIAYKRSGNAGMEYYLIFGDPNATRTRSSLILKVAMPFEIRR